MEGGLTVSNIEDVTDAFNEEVRPLSVYCVSVVREPCVRSPCTGRLLSVYSASVVRVPRIFAIRSLIHVGSVHPSLLQLDFFSDIDASLQDSTQAALDRSGADEEELLEEFEGLMREVERQDKVRSLELNSVPSLLFIFIRYVSLCASIPLCASVCLYTSVCLCVPLCAVI